jgi:polygalacturonase
MRTTHASLLAVLGAWLALASAQAAEFRAGDYGAKGDGRTLDTAAIQKAIDAAAAAGGGTIVFQPGVYLSGSLFLKKGTHLRLDQGVEIRGVQDLSAYPRMRTRIAGIEMTWPAALINVYEQSNVRISGQGTIDGDGRVGCARSMSREGCAGRRTTTASARGSSRSTSPRRWTYAA